VMTQKKPPAGAKPEKQADPHDPFKMRSLEQILTLFDAGGFMAEIMTGHQSLMQDLRAHADEHGAKGCEGSMVIKLKYAVGHAGDVGMGASVTFTPPKKPPSSAAAFINDAGELTLYSPMMRQMHQPVRDVTDYDPETGEIRDAD